MDPLSPRDDPLTQIDGLRDISKDSASDEVDLEGLGSDGGSLEVQQADVD